MKNPGRIILDTNIISDINNNVPETIAFLQSVQEIFTSSIVAGELFYGIENSTRKTQNLQFYRDFFARCAILDVTVDTAEVYGTIKTQLKRNTVQLSQFLHVERSRDMKFTLKKLILRLRSG